VSVYCERCCGSAYCIESGEFLEYSLVFQKELCYVELNGNGLLSLKGRFTVNDELERI
jgi:hypothetical protein